MAKQRKKSAGFIKRGQFWHLITDPITGGRITTKCHTLEGAIEFRNHRERLRYAQDDPAARASLGEWIGKYWASKRQGRVAQATLTYIETKLGHLRRLLGDERKLSGINPGVFDWYVSQRRLERGRSKDGKPQPVSDRTIIRELRELLCVLRLAKRAGCYAGDLQSLMPTTLDAAYHPRERALSEPEIVALLEALPTPKWRAYAAICVALGCRKSEAERLQPEYIDARTVTNEAVQGVEEIFVWIDGRKTRRSNRVVPVLSSFRNLFKLALPELPIGPITNTNRTFRIACNKAGIALCCSNDLRRSHASLVGSRGLPNDLIAKLLGHETVTMSRRVYNRAQATQLLPVAEKVLSQADPIEFPSELAPITRKAPGRVSADRPELH